MPPKSRKSVSETGELSLTRLLPCALTEEEFAAKGRVLADMLQEIAQAEEEKKAASADANAKIKEMEAGANNLKDMINRGTEDREVECVWKKNKPEAGIKSLIRLDTKEVVTTQDMNLLDGGSDESNPLTLPPTV